MTDQPEKRTERKRYTGIRNLTPGLTERGKIKIGMKGAERQSQGGSTWQPPVKLEHFLVTSLAKGKDNNFIRDEKFHKKNGDKPREIPVVLIYDDIDLNLQTRYACYAGKTLWCSGDGVEATRITRAPVKADRDRPAQPAQYEQVQCPCYRQEPGYEGKDKCKINGNLSVFLPDSEAIGGVWKFRTTSYNSVVGLMSSLALIKRITGGPLAGLPLWLTLNEKTVANPVDGAQQKIQVVGIEYRGSVETLRSSGVQELLTRQTHGMRIEHIEQQALELLSTSPGTYAAGDSVEDDLAEFYPEQLEVGDAPIEGEVIGRQESSTPPPPPATRTPTRSPAANAGGAIGEGLEGLVAAGDALPETPAEAVTPPPPPPPPPPAEAAATPPAAAKSRARSAAGKTPAATPAPTPPAAAAEPAGKAGTGEPIDLF